MPIGYYILGLVVAFVTCVATGQSPAILVAFALAWGLLDLTWRFSARVRTWGSAIVDAALYWLPGGTPPPAGRAVSLSATIFARGAETPAYEQTGVDEVVVLAYDAAGGVVDGYVIELSEGHLVCS